MFVSFSLWVIVCVSLGHTLVWFFVLVFIVGYVFCCYIVCLSGINYSDRVI